MCWQIGFKIQNKIRNGSLSRPIFPLFLWNKHAEGILFLSCVDMANSLSEAARDMLKLDFGDFMSPSKTLQYVDYIA